jgi:hypothetical protein
MVFGVVIAIAMISVIQADSPFDKAAVRRIEKAGPASDPGTVDESAQSNIRRSEDDIPEAASTTMADFAYLSHRERDTVRHDILRFWTPDTIEGRVHSNDCIYIAPGFDRPVFKGRVTTSCGIEPPDNHARFNQGWGYAAPIIFPDRAEGLSENAGVRLRVAGPDSLIQIVLDGNQIRWRKCGLVEINGVDSIRCYPTTIASSNVAMIPESGVVFVDGKAWVSASRGRGDIMDGEFPERAEVMPDAFLSRGFDGVMTIGCSDTLIITDNLIYKHSLPDFRVPSTLDSCADVLGLVSEKFIMMHRQVGDTLYVHAAMAAIAGSISVQDIYWYTPPGWSNLHQSLVIYGSIAQRNRGIIHTTYPCGANFCERGFLEKDYRYDVRLRTNPPPHFIPALSRQSWVGDDTLRY